MDDHKLRKIRTEAHRAYREAQVADVYRAAVRQRNAATRIVNTLIQQGE